MSKRVEGNDSSFRRISVEKSMQNVDGRDLWPLTSSPLTHRFTLKQAHTHAVGEDSSDLKILS